MATNDQKANRNSTGAAGTDVLGDLGDTKTWQPPAGEQGLSNRADDEVDEGSDEVDGESSEEAEREVIEQLQTGSRPRRAGQDPVGENDPNAEDASLAADAEGVEKVRALKDETEAPSPKDQDAKGTGGRRFNEVIR